ncbi:MAG: helix-turn-helix transcriptional regulator, partial [Treponema sp.]|nr:helix-turn-helix transcriptional regulator [Treponema sp.]
VDRAQELLLNTDETISRISAKCGFCSPCYMTEQFVRCLNITPSEFRKRQG